MNDADSSAPTGKRYGAFPAVLAVFLAFVVGYGIQIAGLVGQNVELRRANVAAQQAMPRALLIGKKIQAVTKDLMEAAPTSPGARQIVNEFEIRAAPAAR